MTDIKYVAFDVHHEAAIVGLLWLCRRHAVGC
jgi:hypothetical protein